VKTLHVNFLFFLQGISIGKCCSKFNCKNTLNYLKPSWASFLTSLERNEVNSCCPGNITRVTKNGWCSWKTQCSEGKLYEYCHQKFCLLSEIANNYYCMHLFWRRIVKMSTRTQKTSCTVVSREFCEMKHVICRLMCPLTE
jgi:hypothetical protein